MLPIEFESSEETFIKSGDEMTFEIIVGDSKNS